MRTYAEEKNIDKYRAIVREKKKRRSKIHKKNNNNNKNSRLMGSHISFYRYACIGTKHTYRLLL
jgi:hypothetical protein